MRLRLSTRRSIAAIVLLAIVSAAAREFAYHRRRDRWAKAELYCRELEATHLREQVFRLQHESSGQPYDTTRPDDYLFYGRFGYPSIPRPFVSWAEEARDHSAWAETFHQDAELAAARKRQAELSLILP